MTRAAAAAQRLNRLVRLAALTSMGVTLSVSLLLTTLAAGVAQASEVVQIPLDGLLSGRAVSTLTTGAVVPWSTGVDKDDGLMTVAAQMFLKQTGVALPDDGRFAADSKHPEIVLHFSNAAPATAPQVHLLAGAGKIEFAVPAGRYTQLILSLTSSYGASPLTFIFSYADGTSTMQQLTLPDWGTGSPLPANQQVLFNLIAGMHKWNRQDQSIDTPSHTITGMALAPAPDRTLTKLEIAKTTAATSLVLWGATGVATSLADGGVDPVVDAGMEVAPDPVQEQDSGVGAVDVATETGGPPVPGITSLHAGCAISGGTAPTSAGAELLLLVIGATGARRRRPQRRGGSA